MTFIPDKDYVAPGYVIELTEEHKLSNGKLVPPHEFVVYEGGQLFPVLFARDNEGRHIPMADLAGKFKVTRASDGGQTYRVRASK